MNLPEQLYKHWTFRTIVTRTVSFIIGFLSLYGLVHGDPLGSSLTYRGELGDQGQPANGSYDFSFGLYDSVSGGAQIGGSVTNLGVGISSGSFVAQLDFGAAPFNGTALWLEIGVKRSGSTDGYIILTPRQPLEMVPFAAYSLNSVSPAQFATGTNALAAGFKNSLTISSNSFSSQIANRIGAVNGIGSGLVLVQSNFSSTFPLTISGPDEGLNTQGFTINNGYSYNFNYNGEPYPIAVIRPTQPGASMPFDLMPNGTNADVWIDLCSNDLWRDASSVEFLRLKKHGTASGGYGEISLGAWGSGVLGNLLLQPNGGNVGIGYFKQEVQPVYPFQVRTALNNNLAAFSVGGTMTLGSFNDGLKDAPLLLKASSVSISTDGGVSRSMTISNNVVNAAGITAGYLNAGSATISNLTVDNFNVPATGRLMAGSATFTNLDVQNFIISPTSNSIATSAAPNVLFNSTNGDLWIDLWSDSGSGYFMRLKQNGLKSGGYAEIGTGVAGQYGMGNLTLQPSGGNVGIGLFSTTNQPVLPLQVHPAPSDNLGAYALNGVMTLASFNDQYQGAPLLLQGASISVTTDDGYSRAMTVSNNILSAAAINTPVLTSTTANITNLVVQNTVVLPSTGIGGAVEDSYILTVSSTNKASLPWPRMSRANRDSISTSTGGGAVYSMESQQPEWSDGNGNWYRFGQRPTVTVVGGSATNAVSANTDILLVKSSTPVTVVFPKAADFVWRKITVKDISGTASTNPVVVTAKAGQVEAGAAYSISANYGHATFVSDGSDWWKVE